MELVGWLLFRIRLRLNQVDPPRIERIIPFLAAFLLLYWNMAAKAWFAVKNGINSTPALIIRR